jgi:hypothetical protein
VTSLLIIEAPEAMTQRATISTDGHR